jgi:drug/metabolite transporter (DMT)-like permease
MSRGSLLGMVLAAMAGVANAFAAILQKRAVDKTPSERREHGFMRHLLRNPLWRLGLGMSFILGTTFILLAQNLIGPALVPGLGASGLIVLAIGSVKLNGEHLRPSEVLGIVLMAFGVFALGYSNLGIPGREVDLQQRPLVARLGAFTGGLMLCWLLSFLLARRTVGEPRGLSMAVSSGFAYALSNLWTQPLIVTIGLVFSRAAEIVELLVFVAACAILVTTNVVGLGQVQEAYKFANASKVMPLQQVPVQIASILIYFVVFLRSSSGAAVALISLGVAMIVASGFLLAKRTADLRVG